MNQGGKRKARGVPYLESWHADVEEFLELRKNTGDDRRRTHDMNTANWVPDLFMKRVMEGGDWTCSRRPKHRTCTTSSALRLKKPTLRRKSRTWRNARQQENPRAATVAQDADHDLSKPAIRGSLSKNRATSAARSSTWAWFTARTCAPRSPSTPTTTKSPCVTWAR